MAFDNETRGRLQRFVTDARALLTSEFANQFQQDYGLDPESGSVAALSSLAHLDDQRLETARILREILDHYLATEMGEEGEARKAVLGRMVREQAFTTLNRLAALRMMEARGLVMECAGKGYQSKAFRLYQQVAGSGLGETGDTYRVFLLSLCDLYADELPLLFDRHYPNGRLFPREPALLPLLELINAAEIEPLWAEDETIGWIYQYFNGKEERKAMRDASQAPRNSRELAVRNQFFTPRYVVEFLVDNTLGRLWFNWTGGRTELRDRCQYLLVKPDEKPEPAGRLRDPRTIKLLDPACGSMHFGLYAFDLLLEIYREAWAWEQSHGPGCLDTDTGSGSTLKPLSQTYADKDAFLRDVPRMIIEHNIFGVDIDPRAAQIASLALWLRAQRAWHDAGVKAQDRPQVGRGQVVAAIAPPAEAALRKRFMDGLDPLDAELFERTLSMLKDLPELGVLLQVESELPALIRKIFGEHGALFRGKDTEQWQKAEARLREALTEYARAGRSSYQGQLFAEDALQGLRIVDVLRDKYDVVVMNPPFGLMPEAAFEYARKNYPNSYVEVLATFVERASQLCTGYVGAITSRAFMVASRLTNFRSETLIGKMHILADLGEQIMDDAFVEAAAYILGDHAPENLMTVDARKHEKKELSLLTNNFLKSPDLFVFDQNKFRLFPRSRIIYYGGNNISRLMDISSKFEPIAGTARQGLTTFDDFRFVRLFWEVNQQTIGEGKTWEFLAKGGAFSRYKPNIHLIMKWKKDGAENREINIAKNGTDAQAKQASDYWRRAGATYSMRSQKGFSARLMPQGCLFTGQGPLICSASKISNDYILGWINSDLIRTLIEMQSNDGKFMSGIIKSLPWLPPNEDCSYLEEASANVCLAWLDFLSKFDVSSPYFSGIPKANNFSELSQKFSSSINSALSAEVACDTQWNDFVYRLYGVNEFEVERIRQRLFEDRLDEENQTEDPTGDNPPSEDESALDNKALCVLLIDYLVGGAFRHWNQCAMENLRPPPSHYDMIPSIPPARQITLPAYSILVSDPSSSFDIVELCADFSETTIGLSAEEIDNSIRIHLGVSTLRQYLSSDLKFFAAHLASFSGSRRKAPIYWPLSTASGGYTLWLYYPSLTGQTLYTAVNDFLEPKLKQVSRDAAVLRDKPSARSRDEDRTLEALQSLELELMELRNALLRIAPDYHPNQEDGVQITAAPLWELFRHRPWATMLKDTWTKLKKGDCDWSHLAMAYWPDRVREKCKTDKSLAIAHDLEHLYVPPEPKAAKPRGRKKAGEA
jgi:hypothetical protein